MIDICGRDAEQFFRSTRGMLPLIESEIKLFSDDWEELLRKLKSKEGYWKKDTLVHMTGMMDDLMKFGLTGPDPNNTNDLVLFKSWRKPNSVENKWDYWNIMDDYIKKNRRKFERASKIYATRGKCAAHTGRPLASSVKFNQSDVELVKCLIVDCLKLFRNYFSVGEEE